MDASLDNIKKKDKKKRKKKKMSTESLYLFCSIAFPILCSVMSVFIIVWFWKQERTEEEKILKEDSLKKEDVFNGRSAHSLKKEDFSLASRRILGTRKCKQRK